MSVLTYKQELTFVENVMRRDVIDPWMVLGGVEWDEKGRMKEGVYGDETRWRRR